MIFINSDHTKRWKDVDYSLRGLRGALANSLS